MRTIRFCLSWMMLLALPLVTQAQFNYITNNGTITIVQYTGGGGVVVIPDTINGHPVTTVGTGAFLQVSGLTSLTFGTNVTTINDRAVLQCHDLSNVSIPGSITNIGFAPFYDCKGMTTITIATNSFYTVTNGALMTKNLKSLIQYPCGLGGSYTNSALVTDVGGAFVGNSLTAIVTDPANAIFSSTNGVLFNKNKTQLISYPGALAGSYTVPTNVTLIVSASFEYAIGLTSVTMGTNVSSIGLFAFFDCPNLTAITVNSTNKFYSSTNGVLFDVNKTQLIQYPTGLSGSYIVPSTVKNIGDGAFSDTIGLTSVVIPNSVTNIASQAFYGCQSLTSLTLGNSVKNIGLLAFFKCQALTSVVFPASVTTLQEQAFSNCGSLTNVCFEGSPPTDGGSVFYFDLSLATVLYVNGNIGWGSTYDGIPTAPCTACSVIAVPVLGITRSGTNVVVTWPINFSGYTLLSTTNLAVPTVWITNTPSPVVVNTNYAVTNTTVGARKFYRLIQ